MEFKNGQANNLTLPLVLKRSPAHIVLQIASPLFFSIVLVIAVIILNGTLENLIPNIGVAVPLFTATMFFVIFLNLATTIAAILKWNAEYYEIHENEIIYTWGIINKKRRSFPIDKVETMNVSQNFIERALDYGDITLLNPVLPNHRRLKLMDIPHPEKYLNLIKQIQQNHIENSPRSTDNIIYRDQEGVRMN